MMHIKGLRKTCLIDFPPYTSAVIYTAGCNFRCPFCHNGSLVVGHEDTPDLPEDSVLAFLESRKKWLDAVVISGGEPTLHKDLPEFCRKIKQMGFKVKLDTNGTNPDMIRQLLEKGLADYIAMDIKARDSRYATVTGMDVELDKITESIRLLKESAIDHEFRTTAVPGLHDETDFEEIGEKVAGGKRFSLQHFRPQGCLDKSFLEKKPFSSDRMKGFKELLDRHISTEIKNG
jgi:pyruvate formate lyase activating enzyme